MTSLAITIRTVDSVPSWPTPAPVVRKLGQPTFGRPRQVQMCEASGISVNPLFHPPIGGHHAHSIPSAGCAPW